MNVYGMRHYPVGTYVSVTGIVEQIELILLNVEDDVMISVKSMSGEVTPFCLSNLAYEEYFKDSIRVGTFGCFTGCIKSCPEMDNMRYVKLRRFDLLPEDNQ